MSITLNSTLKAAQDGQSHHIILDIVSQPIVPDIPFVGSFLTEETTNEAKPNTITHSNGRVYLVYKFGTTAFKFVYTDEDRTYFNFVTLSRTDLGMGPSETVQESTICEMDNGNLGMIFIGSLGNNIYLRRAIISPTGTVQSYGLIQTFSKTNVYNVISPFVINLTTDGYLLAYLKGSQLQPTSSGTYTGTNNGEYIVSITADGDNTTAKFKWKKDDGGWSAEITCTGAPQLLAEGVNITFVPGSYLAGMIFRISVTAARKAVGYISILSNALHDDQVIIGVNTYTYKSSLPGGGNPNEVAIDIMGREITLENLNCAINHGTFEGTGEGVRYGNGTVEHPDVESGRDDYTLSIRAKVAGAAGNSITITVPSGRFSASSMSGGADSTIGSVRAQTSSIIKKRTSNDFITWSAETDIQPGGVVANEKINLSLKQLSNGDVWVMFDNYDDLLWTNCYYAISSDNGVSWGNAVALTNYDSPLAGGRHPVLVQKSETSVYFVYHEARGALHMDSDSVGWPGGASSITEVHIYNGKIYAVATYTGYGTKYFIAVIEIEIATWRITNSWTTTSIPNFHTVFANDSIWWGCNRSGGKYVVIGTETPTIAVLNVETNTIKHYYFCGRPVYGIIKNVNWEPSNPTYQSRTLAATYIDEDNDRLYVILIYNYAIRREIDIVYIDLTEELVPGSTYNVTTVYNSVNYFTEVQLRGIKSGDFKVYPNSNLAFMSSYSLLGPASLTAFSIDEESDVWAVYKNYTGDDATKFPYYGIINFLYYNSYLYCTFDYYVNEPNKKGLCRINIEADPDYAFTFMEPVWPVQYNDYELYDLTVTNDGKIIVTSLLYGISIYDTGTGLWTLYDNDSVIGLTPSGENIFNTIAYDETTGLMVGGTWFDTDWCGVTAFNQSGLLNLPKYRIGTYTVDWNFAAASSFVVGLLDSQAVVTLDPDDNGIYAFWVKQDTLLNELSIKWAKETPVFNLMPYVVKQVPIIIDKSIETKKSNTITFSVSHGHLFDPFNDISLWRNYVAKGRKLVVRMGEKTGGIDYWQNMGSYLITERSMITYEREKYPVMEIKAEDKRIFWLEGEIQVSTNYEQKTPEYILGHLIENEGGEDVTDIDIPTFNNSTNLYVQWTDTDLLTIIEQICNRYGYFLKITVDDKITCRKISDTNTVTHTYTTLNKLITYTPDDTFSDHTNKIIVTCEGRDEVERIFPMERVLFLTGTMGWWGQKKDRKEYFSDNREKRVMNPLIKKLETTEGIMFELAGKVKESIAETDPDYKYVIVRIEAPDLRPALIGAIAVYVGGSQIPGHIGDMTKTAAFILIVNILASIANYQFEVWGNPIGYVRQSWQATAEDADLQALAGKTIEKKIDEPLAYYINEAQDVANHEMLILKLQRKRIKISKIAHLQDEEGDTVQIKHPYSNYDKKIFITNLRRTLKLSETPEGDGSFIDDIDGWLL